MKNKKLSSIILVIITAIVIYFLLKGNFKEIMNSIIHVNFLWIIITIILYTLYLVLQTIPFHDFGKIYSKNLSFSYMFYIIIVTNFFNGITPLATGGQPLQIYELHKKNISTVDASNIVIQNSIIFQLSVVIWSFIAIIINNTFHIFIVSNTLKKLVFIGFTLNVLLLLVFIIISFSKTFNQKIINGIISILSKLHIIKRKEKQIEKWNNICTEFYDNSKILLNNKLLLIKGIILLLIAFAFYYTIPFTIAKALDCSGNLTIISTIFLSSYVFLSSNYLPIPGATGGMEYSFMGYFNNYVSGFKLKALLIIWRFITYYLPTIIGGIIFNIYTLKTKKEEMN